MCVCVCLSVCLSVCLCVCVSLCVWSWYLNGHGWEEPWFTELAVTRITKGNEEKYIFRLHWERGWKVHDWHGDSALEDSPEVRVCSEQFHLESQAGGCTCMMLFPSGSMFCSLYSGADQVSQHGDDNILRGTQGRLWMMMLFINLISKCFWNGLNCITKS